VQKRTKAEIKNEGEKLRKREREREIRNRILYESYIKSTKRLYYNISFVTYKCHRGEDAESLFKRPARYIAQREELDAVKSN